MNQSVDIKKVFTNDFRWNAAGSIIFELMKTTHLFFLFHIMPKEAYGMMGYIFSIIYLTVSLSDLGFTHSLPPFLSIFTKSQKNFRKIFIPYFSTQLLIFGGAAVLATLKAIHTYPELSTNYFVFIIGTLIILEGVRASTRFFLHTLFVTQSTTVIEIFITLLLLTSIWYPYVMSGKIPTVSTIFTPYLATSIIGVVALCINLTRTYKQLPSFDEYYHEQPGLTQRILKARLFNFSAIQLSKQLFSTNFLITLFSTSLGLEKTGTLKFASYLADAIKAIVKSTIGFSGNALLAYHKHETLTSKRTAFYWIGEKFFKLYTPIISSLITAYFLFTRTNGNPDTTQSTIIYAILFIGIGLMDHLFYIYEQFYMVEEQAAKLFYIRGIEWVLLYLLFKNWSHLNVVTTLLLLIAIRTLSLASLLFHAYRQWAIIPMIKPGNHYHYIIFSIIGSLALGLLCLKFL